MILSDTDLKAWIRRGGVNPPALENVGPASLDLRLGDTIRTTRWYWKPGLWRLVWALLPENRRAHTLIDERGNRYSNPIYWNEPRKFEKYLLKPGEFVLCTSLEITRIPDMAMAFLLSRSGTGRRGIEQLHAGAGDPGFGDNARGGASWTWELTNCAPWPNLLEAGKPLMQLVLMMLASCPMRTYKQTGHYNDQVGPTACLT